MFQNLPIVRVFLLTWLLASLQSVKSQTLLFPDCSNGNLLPTCVNGGTIINVGSANPIAGATPGWAFAASPQSDNVAWQLYSNKTTSVIGNARCAGFTYGGLTTVGAGGNLWAVITLRANTNVVEQPLLGIFAANNNICPLIYSLPSAIIGGPVYVYTTVDDGSHPEILTRAKLTSRAFPCAAPLTTPVSYILFGTMQVSVGSFVLLYAGFNVLNPVGCSASYTFSLPASTAVLSNPGVNGAVIVTPASNVAAVVPAGTVANTPLTTNIAIPAGSSLVIQDLDEEKERGEIQNEIRDEMIDHSLIPQSILLADGAVVVDASIVTEVAKLAPKLPFGNFQTFAKTQMPTQGPINKDPIKTRFLRK